MSRCFTRKSANEDPVDGAIRAAAPESGVPDLPKLLEFVPFDPAKKMSEATVLDSAGARLRIVKGAFAAVARLAQHSTEASTAADELEAQGFRVLAVAVGADDALALAGIIALSDPPRTDSAGLITELHALGVRTVMVTGDAPATAASFRPATDRLNWPGKGAHGLCRGRFARQNWRMIALSDGQIRGCPRDSSEISNGLEAFGRAWLRPANAWPEVTSWSSWNR